MLFPTINTKYKRYEGLAYVGDDETGDALLGLALECEEVKSKIVKNLIDGEIKPFTTDHDLKEIQKDEYFETATFEANCEQQNILLEVHREGKVSYMLVLDSYYSAIHDDFFNVKNWGDNKFGNYWADDDINDYSESFYEMTHEKRYRLAKLRELFDERSDYSSDNYPVLVGSEVEIDIGDPLRFGVYSEHVDDITAIYDYFARNKKTPQKYMTKDGGLTSAIEELPEDLKKIFDRTEEELEEMSDDDYDPKNNLYTDRISEICNIVCCTHYRDSYAEKLEKELEALEEWENDFYSYEGKIFKDVECFFFYDAIDFGDDIPREGLRYFRDSLDLFQKLGIKGLMYALYDEPDPSWEFSSVVRIKI